MYKINLTWKKLEKQFYGTCYKAHIFGLHTLYITHNGEDWWNIEVFDQNGNETGGIAGGKTIKAAKIEAEKWLIQQCKSFLKKESNKSQLDYDFHK